LKGRSGATSWGGSVNVVTRLRANQRRFYSRSYLGTASCGALEQMISTTNSTGPRLILLYRTYQGRNQAIRNPNPALQTRSNQYHPYLTITLPAHPLHPSPHRLAGSRQLHTILTVAPWVKIKVHQSHLEGHRCRTRHLQLHPLSSFPEHPMLDRSIRKCLSTLSLIPRMAEDLAVLTDS